MITRILIDVEFIAGTVLPRTLPSRIYSYYVPRQGEILILSGDAYEIVHVLWEFNSSMGQFEVKLRVKR